MKAFIRKYILGNFSVMMFMIVSTSFLNQPFPSSINISLSWVGWLIATVISIIFMRYNLKQEFKEVEKTDAKKY